MRNVILTFIDNIYSEVVSPAPIDNTPVPNQRETKRVVPKLYRTTGALTMFFCVFGFIFMFADAVFSIFGIGFSVYIIWCACCLSLFFTNKIALEDWKSINEQQRELSQENHNS